MSEAPVLLLSTGDPTLPANLNGLPVAAVGDDILAEPKHLDRAQALLVSMHADQRWLQRHRRVLEAFLGRGGRLVVSGQIAHPFLEPLAPFEPIAPMKVERLDVRIEPPVHPLFEGVAAEDLTRRRGVVGFYGRGGHPLPAGGRLLASLDHGRVALDWLLPWPGGGALLVHAGNDLWSYADDESSAARLAPQLVRWLLEDALEGWGED